MVIRFSLTVEKILAFFMSLGSREFCEIDRLLMADFRRSGPASDWSTSMQTTSQVECKWVVDSYSPKIPQNAAQGAYRGVIDGGETSSCVLLIAPPRF